MNDYIILRDGIQKEYNYRTSEILGKGQFGKVYKGYDANGVLFAIKTIDLKEVQKNHNTGSLVYMRREVELMKEISVYSHDNTVNLLASFEKDSVLYLVMECCQTDLAKFIVSKQPALGLPEDLCRKFLLQLVTGLKFLNDHNIIHRDLKPPNILLLEDSDYTTLKISDFGLSKKIDMTTSQVGSPLYMAPEVITHLPYTFKYDVWSAGCIFFEMLTGKNPFDSYRLNDLRELNKTQRTPNLSIDIFRSINSRSPYKENKIVVSDMALELLSGLLTYDQKKRWNWNEVLGCNYFRNDFLKISVLNFPNQASKEFLPEPVVKKPVDIVLEEKPIPKIQNKYRQRRVTCHLFHPYGSERQLLLNPGKVYTIQGIKDSTKCQNCKLFNLNGVLYSNDMILLNADCENPNGFEVNDLYFVDFEAAAPPPFRFPQGEYPGALPVVPLVTNDSYDAINLQEGRQRIGELCYLSRNRLYNVNLMSQNLLLVLRQLYNTIYSIKIQKKILIVVQSHVYGELVRQKELVSKYMKEFDILSKQVPLQEELPIPADNYSEAVPVLSPQYNIVSYSQSLRTNLESLLAKITSLTSDRESPLKQTFIMENANFDKNYITPLLASIEAVDGSKKQKFQDALIEATKLFKYDFETGAPPKFPFPDSMNLATNASEFNATLNLTCLPIYNDISTIYADALQKRSTFESEIDKSLDECYGKLKAFKTIYDQAQTFNEILENLAVGYSQFEKAVKDILGLKVQFSELSRQAKIMGQLEPATEYCDKVAEKEIILRDQFQVMCKSPPLDRLFPDLEPPQKSNVVSNGVLKKEISGGAKLVEITKQFYNAVEDNYSNTKISEPLIVEAIPNNTNIINKREEERLNAVKALEMAQIVIGENGRKIVSPDKMAENIADEREKSNAFETKIAEAEKILSKQESEISIQLAFYTSVVGEDLLSTFRKNCEVREENGPSIKEQFLSGPYSNPKLQFELWTLKALAAVVLDSKPQPTDKQLDEAKRNLLKSKLNWERAVSFSEL